MPEVNETIARMPPQALDAEISVIGSMMLDPLAVSTAIELLDESCFYKEAHRRIFLAALALHEKNEAVDILTLANELEVSGEEIEFFLFEFGLNLKTLSSR